jgi:hypothetical protein
MRKVVAVELVSVDGVMEAPEEWTFPYSNDEMDEANASGMASSDALLLGRVTYEGLAAFWPNQPPGTPMVDYINGVPKFVVSGDPGGAPGVEQLHPDQGERRGGGSRAQAATRQGHLDHRKRRPRERAAGRGAPRRAQAHGSPDRLGQREAPLQRWGR